MIVRVFRAHCKPGMREAFARLCLSKSIPDMRAEPGLLNVYSGRPPLRPDEFVLVSLWKDLDGLKAFTGDRWEDPVILPGEAPLIFEVTIQHFDESYRSLCDLRRVLGGALRDREIRTVRNLRLSDAQWERVRGLLPPPKREGRPRADDRRTLEGILYVLRTGCRWQDLPADLGNSVTCWRRLAGWEADGTWERTWRALFATLTTREKLAWADAFLGPARRPTKRGQRGLRDQRDETKTA